MHARKASEANSKTTEAINAHFLKEALHIRKRKLKKTNINSNKTSEIVLMNKTGGFYNHKNESPLLFSVTSESSNSRPLEKKLRMLSQNPHSSNPRSSKQITMRSSNGFKNLKLSKDSVTPEATRVNNKNVSISFIKKRSKEQTQGYSEPDEFAQESNSRSSRLVSQIQRTSSLERCDLTNEDHHNTSDYDYNTQTAGMGKLHSTATNFFSRSQHKRHAQAQNSQSLVRIKQ